MATAVTKSALQTHSQKQLLPTLPAFLLPRRNESQAAYASRTKRYSARILAAARVLHDKWCETNVPSKLMKRGTIMASLNASKAEIEDALLKHVMKVAYQLAIHAHAQGFARARGFGSAPATSAHLVEIELWDTMALFADKTRQNAFEASVNAAAVAASSEKLFLPYVASALRVYTVVPGVEALIAPLLAAACVEPAVLQKAFDDWHTYGASDGGMGRTTQPLLAASAAELRRKLPNANGAALWGPPTPTPQNIRAFLQQDAVLHPHTHKTYFASSPGHPERERRAWDERLGVAQKAEIKGGLDIKRGELKSLSDRIVNTEAKSNIQTAIAVLGEIDAEMWKAVEQSDESSAEAILEILKELFENVSAVMEDTGSEEIQRRARDLKELSGVLSIRAKLLLRKTTHVAPLESGESNLRDLQRLRDWLSALTDAEVKHELENAITALGSIYITAANALRESKPNRERIDEIGAYVYREIAKVLQNPTSKKATEVRLFSERSNEEAARLLEAGVDELQSDEYGRNLLRDLRRAEKEELYARISLEALGRTLQEGDPALARAQELQAEKRSRHVELSDLVMKARYRYREANEAMSQATGLRADMPPRELIEAFEAIIGHAKRAMPHGFEISEIEVLTPLLEALETAATRTGNVYDDLSALAAARDNLKREAEIWSRAFKAVESDLTAVKIARDAFNLALTSVARTADEAVGKLKAEIMLNLIAKLNTAVLELSSRSDVKTNLASLIPSLTRELRQIESLQPADIIDLAASIQDFTLIIRARSEAKMETAAVMEAMCIRVLNDIIQTIQNPTSLSELRTRVKEVLRAITTPPDASGAGAPSGAARADSEESDSSAAAAPPAIAPLSTDQETKLEEEARRAKAEASEAYAKPKDVFVRIGSLVHLFEKINNAYHMTLPKGLKPNLELVMPWDVACETLQVSRTPENIATVKQLAANLIEMLTNTRTATGDPYGTGVSLPKPLNDILTAFTIAIDNARQYVNNATRTVTSQREISDTVDRKEDAATMPPAEVPEGVPAETPAPLLSATTPTHASVGDSSAATLSGSTPSEITATRVPEAAGAAITMSATSASVSDMSDDAADAAATEASARLAGFALSEIPATSGVTETSRSSSDAALIGSEGPAARSIVDTLRETLSMYKPHMYPIENKELLKDYVRSLKDIINLVGENERVSDALRKELAGIDLDTPFQNNYDEIQKPNVYKKRRDRIDLAITNLLEILSRYEDVAVGGSKRWSAKASYSSSDDDEDDDESADTETDEDVDDDDEDGAAGRVIAGALETTPGDDGIQLQRQELGGVLKAYNETRSAARRVNFGSRARFNAEFRKRILAKFPPADAKRILAKLERAGVVRR